jgi:hypothetical protein
MIDHVTLHVTDVRRGRVFYEARLRPLGISAIAASDGGPAVGCFGPDPGSFWLARPGSPAR